MPMDFQLYGEFRIDNILEKSDQKRIKCDKKFLTFFFFEFKMV